jgi:hypothetical protein
LLRFLAGFFFFWGGGAADSSLLLVVFELWVSEAALSCSSLLLPALLLEEGFCRVRFFFLPRL